ncbi:MAG: hypothetical protein ACOC56_00480 [Atribacterota bacterium]
MITSATTMDTTSGKAMTKLEQAIDRRRDEIYGEDRSRLVTDKGEIVGVTDPSRQQTRLTDGFDEEKRTKRIERRDKELTPVEDIERKGELKRRVDKLLPKDVKRTRENIRQASRELERQRQLERREREIRERGGTIFLKGSELKEVGMERPEKTKATGEPTTKDQEAIQKVAGWLGKEPDEMDVYAVRGERVPKRTFGRYVLGELTKGSEDIEKQRAYERQAPFSKLFKEGDIPAVTRKSFRYVGGGLWAGLEAGAVAREQVGRKIEEKTGLRRTPLPTVFDLAEKKPEVRDPSYLKGVQRRGEIAGEALMFSAFSPVMQTTPAMSKTIERQAQVATLRRDLPKLEKTPFRTKTVSFGKDKTGGIQLKATREAGDISQQVDLAGTYFKQEGGKRNLYVIPKADAVTTTTVRYPYTKKTLGGKEVKVLQSEIGSDVLGFYSISMGGEKEGISKAFVKQVRKGKPDEITWGLGASKQIKPKTTPLKNLYFSVGGEAKVKKVGDLAALKFDPKSYGTGTYLDLSADKADEITRIFSGAGKKSSSRFYDQLFKTAQETTQKTSPQEAAISQGIVSTLKTKPITAITKPSKEVLETTSAYAGLGLYERTRETGAMLPRVEAREKPIQTGWTIPRERDREITTDITISRQRGGQRPRERQEPRLIQQPIQRPDEAIGQVPRGRVTQRPSQRQRPAQRGLLRPLFRGFQQGTFTTPRLATRGSEIGTPFFRLFGTREREVTDEKKPKKYKVYVREKGEDVKIGSYKTKKKARKELFEELKETLRASGFIKVNDKKVRIPLGFSRVGEYRYGKKDPFRVVQRKTRRFGTAPEVQEAQLFRQKKSKSWLS